MAYPNSTPLLSSFGSDDIPQLHTSPIFFWIWWHTPAPHLSYLLLDLMTYPNSAPLLSSFGSDNIPQVHWIFWEQNSDNNKQFPPTSPTVSMDETAYSSKLLQIITPITEQFVLKGPWTLILTDFSFRSPLWYIPPTKYFHTCLSNHFIFFKYLKCLWIAKQDQYVMAEWAREITSAAAWSYVFWPRVYLEP